MEIMDNKLEKNENRKNENKDDEEKKADNSYKFGKLNSQGYKQGESNINFILDLPIEITVELGNTRMRISELLKLGQGSIIELSKDAGTSFDILANKKMIAKGEVVIVNEKYGVRLTEVINPFERVENLK